MTDDEARESSTIGPAKPDSLIDAHRGRRFDPRTRELLAREFATIAPWLESTGHRPTCLDDHPHTPACRGTLMGLALSGGGIRSATFALGVMQALANKDLMRKFDYLSTVSGGGYIGSSLCWWLSSKSSDAQDRTIGLGKDFPYGTDDPSRKPDAEPPSDSDPQRNALRYLRQHGNYLTPGRGLDLAAALFTTLRGVFLSLTFWALLAVTAQCLVLMAGGWFGEIVGSPGRVFASRLALNEALYGRLTAPCVTDASCVDPCTSCTSMVERVLSADGGAWLFPFDLVLLFAALLALASVLAALIYSFATAFSLGTTSARYEMRRDVEKLSGAIGKAVLTLAVLGSLPLVAALVGSWVTQVGVGGLLAGAASAAWAFLKPKPSSAESKAGMAEFVTVLASALLIYGGLLGSYATAWWLLDGGGSPDLVDGSQLLGVLSIVLLAYGYVVNVNYVSLHRFYRDRIMETFLPDVDQIHRENAPDARKANKAKLAEVWSGRSPYPLINANVVLVDTKDRTRELRGGDAFLLSPAFCGSNATGWCETASFGRHKLTLATAVAISGAAANPNTGVGGKGVTRSRAVSLLMTAFGLRLGYWVTSPKTCSTARPTHFNPILEAAIENSLHEGSKFLELTDGGHFENLALYELVRRRVRLIVLCDGAADEAFCFSDFQTAIRRIEEDFGARIRFDDNNQLEHLIPNEAMGYPPDAKAAERGHIVGTISYCDGTEGVLVYLKTTTVENLSLKTKGYKGSNPDFPDQPTTDQFFDEDQFEAYRELGYRLARHMLDGLTLTTKQGVPVRTLAGLIDSIEHPASAAT